MKKNHSGILLMIIIMAIIGSVFGIGKKSDKNSLNQSNTRSNAPVHYTAASAYADCPILDHRVLMLDYADYEGQKVRVVVSGSYSCGYPYDELFDRSYGDVKSFKAKLDNPSPNYGDVPSGYAPVIGGFVFYNESGNYVELKNAVLVGQLERNGAEVAKLEADYNALVERMKNEQAQRDAEKAEQEELEFKNSAIKASYEDLMRYPDTYTDKPVLLTVVVKKVQLPDGIKDSLADALFGTPIICVMPDSEEIIVLYDKRDVAEPTILEGDTLTFYGYGNGLTEMKDYYRTIIGTKRTVNQYQVPCVCVRYNYE